MQNSLRQPVESAWRAAGDESDVSTLAGKFPLDTGGDLGCIWQCRGWQKRVVERVEQQSWQVNTGQLGFAGSAAPVIVCSVETVQRGSNDVVELIQRVGGVHALPVEQAGIAQQFFGRMAF